MKRLLFIVLSLTTLHGALFADESQEPLFAGTLLAFFPDNIDPGRFLVQPYMFFTRQSGIYNREWDLVRNRNIHQYELFVVLETGITKNIDIALFLDGYVTHGHRHTATDLGDTELSLGFQIMKNKKGEWTPDFRIVLGESFPTGKYDELNPSLVGADATGTGSYETFGGIVLRKIFYDIPCHPYNINLNLFYTLFSDVRVHGVSFAGGDHLTSGVVNPGGLFMANLAFELSLTHNWACGLDIHYEHQAKTTFHPSAAGSTLAGLPSFERISLAPCLEYNVNENFGVEGGVWFTVAGRNAIAFLSGVATIYYEF